MHVPRTLRALVFVLFAATVHAETFYVNGTTGNDAWSGRCETFDGELCGPKRTIQAAINATIADGDVVVVADGIYSGAGNRDLQLPVRAILVKSQNGADACTIDAQLAGRCIQSFASGGQPVTVEGFTFLNAVSQGIAVNVTAGAPVIRNCVFRGMRNARALSVSSATTITLEGCLFEDNVASSPQAPRPVQINGACALSGCVFRNNRVEGASPIVLPTSGSIRGCRFEKNTATETGGALSLPTLSTVLIENCVFRSNRAATGGAIWGLTPRVTIRNCEFSGNRALLSGGALHFGTSLANIVNCAFLDNRSDGDGGAVSLAGANGTNFTSVTNSILIDNVAVRGPHFALSGARLAVDHSNVAGGQSGIFSSGATVVNWGSANIDADPGFAFANGDLRLVAGSPCIDAGTATPPGGLSGSDPEGVARSLDGDGDPDGIPLPDIGVYEFDPTQARIAVPAEKLTLHQAADGPNVSVPVGLVRSVGGLPLDWSVAADCSWLSLSPASGQSLGEIDDVTLTVDASGLTPGTHVCNLTVAAPGATNSPRSVQVVLQLNSIRHVPGAHATIQAAVDAAADGDTIALAPGVYSGPGNFGVTIIGKTVRIVGQGSNPSDCAVDAQFAGSAFIIRDAGRDQPIEFENVTIRKGRAARGGACLAEDAGLLFRNCHLEQNESVPTTGGGFSGAALFVFLTQLTLEDCEIFDNAASWSGAVRTSWSTLHVARCRFSGNQAGSDGGALSMETTTGDVADCVFEGNTSEDCGGALHEERSCQVTYARCEFVGNTDGGCGGGSARIIGSQSSFSACEFRDTAGSNGVVSISSGAPRFSDCAFSPAASAASASGIRAAGGDLIVTAERCTFGPGLNWGAIVSGGTLRLTDCVLEGNFTNGVRLENSNGTFVRSRFGNAPSSVWSMIEIEASSSVPAQVMVLSCQFAGNTAAIRGNNGVASINAINSVFRGNQYIIYMLGSCVFHATNCTFLGSGASAEPLIRLTAEQPNSITNSIIWRAAGGQDLSANANTPLTVRHSLLRSPWPGQGNIVGNPMLSTDSQCGPVPLDGSPVIDAGDSTAIPADSADLDQDGDVTEPLPLDFAGRVRSLDDPETVDTGVGPAPVVDIGAFEFRRIYGDLNDDNHVDVTDLALLLSAFGGGSAGDLDGDGDTDVSDLALLLSSFGEGC